jgi:quercetin dioxygenase-like cupin family protein
MTPKTSKNFLSDSAAEWRKTADAGVERKILGYDPLLMVVKVKFEKEACGSFHTHPHSQSSYIASGKFEFTIDGEKQTVAAGDGFYVAPNVLHGCKCIDAGVIIDTFSPMREDFL